MRDIRIVALAGAGIMGAAIAQVVSGQAEQVIVYDTAPAQFTAFFKMIGQAQQALIESGLLTPDGAQAALARIQTTADLAAFSKADLVIESIVENLGAKQALFTKLEQICPAETIFATNTSSLRIGDIAAPLQRKACFLGANWWTPAHIIPLVEVVRIPETTDSSVDRLCGFLRALGKQPVILNREADGFIGNRLQFALLREALYIVEQGIAEPEAVDLVMTAGLGMRYAVLGPFRTADFGGLDTFYHIANNLFSHLCTDQEAPAALARLYQAGKYGAKTEEGFYRYGSGQLEQALKQRDQALIAILKLAKEQPE